jgi:hypothetical protein
MSAQRERKRSADKSRAENGNAMKCGGGFFGHEVMCPVTQLCDAASDGRRDNAALRHQLRELIRK